eukprot:TRINITY_DN48247_c0_g1_i1.p1 TRINITY_DN48247_c0_g1~~TRINITY_DN48247_c0_g1_i1.p1  ORF type:complete len:629 (-),score=144.61 TRINITY_DN48247_c0_g1_i1:330-2216(-)
MGGGSSAIADYDPDQDANVFLQQVRAYHCPPPPQGWAIFRYTGSDQTFETKGRTQFQVEVWGAQGGQHGGRPPSGPGFPGGPGGYAKSNITIPKGTQHLTIIVGQAGMKGYQHFTSYGGGGKSGKDGDFGGGGGGGRSAILLDGTDIITAGGGGGGGCGYGGGGGAGGGLIGKDADGTGTEPGRGGSQTQGGNGGFGTGKCASGLDKVGSPGAHLLGGNADARPAEGAAGGGGGYFGGGAGGSSGGALGIHHYGGGGGGSGFAGDSRIKYERTELICGDDCFWERPQPDGRPNGLVILRFIDQAVPDSVLSPKAAPIPGVTHKQSQQEQLALPPPEEPMPKEEPRPVATLKPLGQTDALTLTARVDNSLEQTRLPPATTVQAPMSPNLPPVPAPGLDMTNPPPSTESSSKGPDTWQSRLDAMADARLNQIGAGPSGQKAVGKSQSVPPAPRQQDVLSLTNESMASASQVAATSATPAASSTDSWKSRLEAQAEARLNQLNMKAPGPPGYASSSANSKSSPGKRLSGSQAKLGASMGGLSQIDEQTSLDLGPTIPNRLGNTGASGSLGSTGNLGASGNLGATGSVGASGSFGATGSLGAPGSSSDSWQARLEAQAEARRQQLNAQQGIK